MIEQINLSKLVSKDAQSPLLSRDEKTQKYHFHSERTQWSGTFADFVTGDGFIIGDGSTLTSFLSLVKKDEDFSKKQDKEDCYSDRESYKQIFQNIMLDGQAKLKSLSIVSLNQIIALSKALEKKLGISANQAMSILAVTSQDLFLASVLLSDNNCSFKIGSVVIHKKDDNTIGLTVYLDLMSSKYFPAQALNDITGKIELQLIPSTNNTEKPTLTMESFHLEGQNKKNLQIAKSLLLSTGESFEIAPEDLQDIRKLKESRQPILTDEKSLVKRIKFATRQLFPVDLSDGQKEMTQSKCPSLTLQLFKFIGKEDFAKNDPTLATGLLVIGAIATVATVGLVAVAATAMASFGLFGNAQVHSKRSKMEIEKTSDYQKTVTAPRTGIKRARSGGFKQSSSESDNQETQLPPTLTKLHVTDGLPSAASPAA